MAKQLTYSSFENTSILRKLSIFYFLISIIPVGILYYFYLEIRDNGVITISEGDFNTTLLLVVAGVGIGYWALRSMLMKVIALTESNRQVLRGILSPEEVADIANGHNEVAILARSFNEITARLEDNVRDLQLAKRTLHSVLTKVGEGIASMDNIDNFLNLILETVTEALGAQRGVLLLAEESVQDLRVKAVFGLQTSSYRHVRLDGTRGLFGPAIQQKQAVLIPSVTRETDSGGLFKAPMLCAPLVLHDDVLGVLAVCGNETPDAFAEEEMGLLYNLGLQTAVAIENSRLSDDAEKTYFETISALALAVEAKDPYSRGHLDRVAKYVVMIGEELGLKDDDIRTMRDAAKLHDIGKIGILDQVLTKNGPLTPEENEMMRRHCEIGEGIIKPIRSLRSLCDLVRHHHEKLDGSGYPDGLKGEEIHPLVRILTVADIFDALTSGRPYRDAFSLERAIDVLRGMRTQVEQRVVDAFERALQKTPV